MHLLNEHAPGARMKLNGGPMNLIIAALSNTKWYVVVNGSFFHYRPWHNSLAWFIVREKSGLGTWTFLFLLLLTIDLLTQWRHLAN